MFGPQCFCSVVNIRPEGKFLLTGIFREFEKKERKHKRQTLYNSLQAKKVIWKKNMEILTRGTFSVTIIIITSSILNFTGFTAAFNCSCHSWKFAVCMWPLDLLAVWKINAFIQIVNIFRKRSVCVIWSCQSFQHKLMGSAFAQKLANKEADYIADNLLFTLTSSIWKG